MSRHAGVYGHDFRSNTIIEYELKEGYFFIDTEAIIVYIAIYMIINDTQLLETVSTLLQLQCMSTTT